MVLTRKEKEITAARQQATKGAPKPPNKRLSMWQVKLDQAQVEQLKK